MAILLWKAKQSISFKLTAPLQTSLNLQLGHWNQPVEQLIRSAGLHFCVLDETRDRECLFFPQLPLYLSAIVWLTFEDGLELFWNGMMDCKTGLPTT